MAFRTRIHGALVLAVVSSLLTMSQPARADQAYDKVATAYAQAGGHLDPCAFTTAQLKAAVRGIPPTIRDVVPELRAAMVEGIAAHQRGDCRGVKPEAGTTGGAAPATTTPTTTTPPVTTQTAPAVPATTTPTVPTTTSPAPAQTSTQPATGTHERDRTPLVVALIAAGALVLLALLLWGWARMRGWDPSWGARMRHGWREAGFRTTSTWSEFTDWLRLGR
jgi:hypothetical protein